MGDIGVVGGERTKVMMSTGLVTMRSVVSGDAFTSAGMSVSKMAMLRSTSDSRLSPTRWRTPHDTTMRSEPAVTARSDDPTTCGGSVVCRNGNAWAMSITSPATFCGTSGRARRQCNGGERGQARRGGG